MKFITGPAVVPVKHGCHRPKTAFQDKTLTQTVNRCGSNVKVWSSFSASGTGSLHEFFIYQSVLDNNVKPSVQKMKMNLKCTFQQDTAAPRIYLMEGWGVHTRNHFVWKQSLFWRPVLTTYYNHIITTINVTFYMIHILFIVCWYSLSIRDVMLCVQVEECTNYWVTHEPSHRHRYACAPFFFTVSEMLHNKSS